MDHSDNGLPFNSKRKAIDSLLSPGIKKPRVSIASRPFPSTSSSFPASSQPKAPSQSNIKKLSTQPNEIPRLASTQIPSRKGKEKVSDSYRDPPFEELFSSTFSKDTKVSSSASNGVPGLTKPRSFSLSQRKTTQQDPISISSDSDEGKEQNILTKKGKSIWKGISQMDIVDLTFSDDNDDNGDEVTVIDIKKLSPNRLKKMKSRRSLEHRIKKAEKSRKDDERILLTEAQPPTILPTPPKSENDEPEYSEDTGTIKQRPRKLTNKKIPDKESEYGASQHSLPPLDSEVIDLCTDDSSDELPCQSLGINGHLTSLLGLASLGADTENVHDTVPSSSSRLLKNQPSPSPGFAETNDEYGSRSVTRSASVGADMEYSHDILDIVLSSSDLIDPGVGDLNEKLPSADEQSLYTEHAHDTTDFVPLSSSDLVDKNPPQPSLDVAILSDQLSSEPLGVDAQLTATVDNPSPSSGLINTGVDDETPDQPLCIDGQPPLETNTESAHDAMCTVPSSSSELIDENNHSLSPGGDELPIASDSDPRKSLSDPMESLLDPISELEINPVLTCCEEEEVLRDVLLEDEDQEEEMLIETPFSMIYASSEEPPLDTGHDNDNAQFEEKHPADSFIVEESVNPSKNNEFPCGSLVKEPDFSKISTQATQPVPDYDDRLSAAIKWPAEKLPTELHDMINALPTNYLYSPHMRHIFEAMIEDNTAADEPRAPKIRIIGRKNGPVTPPWEFYYTNRIVNGEGVPRSDKKLLQGCDCIGPCDPKSKTCACVQRQMAWTGGDIKGFLYRKERLLHPHYPVFECNDACECSEECMNRVIQHGRKHPLSITLTKNKGWGVFADEKIPRGTYLGIYAGEMILEAEADERGKLYDRYGRTYLFDLDFYHLRALDKDKYEGTSTYTIDAFHAGNFTRFLNHSCDPNCQITPTYVNEPDLHKPALTIFTSRDVQKGEELTFSYLGEADDDDDDKTDEEINDGMIKVEAGPSSHKQQAVHRRCLCGASNCRGQMF